MFEYSLDATLTQWLDEHAEAMDQQPGYAAEVLQQMAPHGLFELGLCERLGGRPDSSFQDALTALIAVAKHSLNAAFILWAQRGVIALLAQQPDHPLTQTLLPLLLSGRVAGAPGLSNLIKFGSGLEPLQVSAQRFQSGWELNGQLPWVSNAQQENFIVALAAQTEEKQAGIFLLPDKADGVVRKPDLSLYSIQSSATTTIRLEQVRVSDEHHFAPCAFSFMRSFRPLFLAQQCALSIGVGLASAQRVRQHDKQPTGFAQQARQLEEQLIHIGQQLVQGVEQQTWIESPKGLFELRLQLATLCTQSAMLELKTEGGAAYVKGQREPTRRRVREAMLLPLITPTVAQLNQ